MILDIGLVNQRVQNQTEGIDEDVPLAPFDFLPAVIPTRPPFCVVFTD